MKTRTGFVSNSSSASFILKKYHMTPEQIAKVKEYLEGKNMEEDGWSWEEDEHLIEGFTSMDNAAFSDFLETTDISFRAIKIENMG